MAGGSGGEPSFHGMNGEENISPGEGFALNPFLLKYSANFICGVAIFPGRIGQGEPVQHSSNAFTNLRTLAGSHTAHSP
jgi:hypothetical protein